MVCCRSCLAEDRPLHSLHQSSKDAFGISYLDCFQLLGCCPPVVDSELTGFVAPTTMCKECLDELRVAFVFRQRCKQSLDELQERFRQAAKNWDGSDENRYEVEILDEEEVVESLDEVEETLGEDVENGEDRSSVCGDGEEILGTIGDDSVGGWARPQTEEDKKVDLESRTDADGFVEESEEYYLDVEQPMDDAEAEENVTVDNVSEAKTICLQCKTCGVVFVDRLVYSEHMRTVHDLGSAKSCDICGIFCTSSVAMKSHMLEHTNSERPFQCDICPKSYFSKAGLISHMTIHSGRKNPQKYLCSECGRSFATSQRLRLHSAIHTGVRNFSCETCDKTFADEFKLRCHRRTHTGERPFHCNECGLRFAQGNALKCHMRLHTGEKPYKCNVCDKSFTQNTILKTHMTLHTGKTVKCPDCDKKFSRASYLILHRREHTGEKPYKCDLCPNQYKQKSHLDRHLDTHLGVRHSCNVCGKTYSKTYTLKQHQRTHTDSKTWPFQCTDCGMGFVRKNRYTAHLKIHSGREMDVHVKSEPAIPEEPADSAIQ